MTKTRRLSFWLSLAFVAGAGLLVFVLVLAGVFDWSASWWFDRIRGISQGGEEWAASPLVRASFAGIVVAATGIGTVCCGRAREAIVVLIGGALCAIMLAAALPTLGVLVEPLSPVLGILVTGVIVLAFFRKPQGAQERQIAAIFDRRASTAIVSAWGRQPELLPWKPRSQEVAILVFRLLDGKTLSEGAPDEDVFALASYSFRLAESILLAEGGWILEREGDGFSVVYGFESGPGPVMKAAMAAEHWRGHGARIANECKNRWGLEPKFGLGIASGLAFSAIDRQHIRLMSEVPEAAVRFAKLNQRFGSSVLLDARAREAAGEELALRALDFEGRGGKWVRGEIFELLGFPMALSDEERFSYEAFAMAMEGWREGDEERAREAFVSARIPGRVDPVLERMITGLGD